MNKVSHWFVDQKLICVVYFGRGCLVWGTLGVDEGTAGVTKKDYFTLKSKYNDIFMWIILVISFYTSVASIYLFKQMQIQHKV